MTVIEPHLAPAMRGHTAVPESEARALDRAHREIVGADLSQAPGSESAIGGQVITRPRSTNDLDVLTPREREVLSLVAGGLTNRAIADRLFVSGDTVHTHIRHIFAKLDLPTSKPAHRRVHAAIIFVRG